VNSIFLQNDREAEKKTLTEEVIHREEVKVGRQKKAKFLR